MDSGTLVALGLLAVFLITDVSPSRDCVKPYIRMTNIRGRGQRARYVCRRPYRLFGTTFSTCMNGRWIPGPPKCGIDCPVTHIKLVNSSRVLVTNSVCVRGYDAVAFITGHCDDDLSTKSYPICIAEECAETYTFCNSNDCNVFATRNLNELYVSCEPGFSPVGPDKVICETSSNPVPFYGCRESQLQFSCDFEKVSDPYCGWGQPKSESSREGAFVWVRKWRAADRHEIIVRSDHTSKVKKRGGVYLYLPAQDLKKGESVRLYSPTYDLSSNQSLSYCFVFWYFMKSPSVGVLNVFVNDEMKWTIAGEQGSSWNEGFVSLPSSNVSIIIEATRGYAADSYIAVDDFLITNSAEAGDHECFAEDARYVDTRINGENFDSDYYKSQFETTLPSVDESTQAADLVPAKTSFQEGPISSSEETSSPASSSEKAHIPSKEIFSSPNPSPEILVSASTSRETSISANLSQEIPTTANPSQKIPAAADFTPDVPISASSTNSSQEVSLSPSQEVPVPTDDSPEVLQQTLHPVNPLRQVHVTVKPLLHDPVTSTVSLQNFSQNATDEGNLPPKSNDPSPIITPKPLLKPTTHDFPSSAETWPSAHYLAETSSSVTVDQKKPTKPLPDTVEGIHLNAHKTGNATELAIAKEKADPASEDIHKHLETNEADISAEGNSIAESDSVSDTHSQFDDALDPNSPVDENPHFSDDSHMEEESRASSVSSSVKFFISKTPSGSTSHFKLSGDIENGLDQDDEHSLHHSDFDEHNCESENCGKDVWSDYDLNDASRHTPGTLGNNNTNREETHQEIKTHRNEGQQGLSGAPPVDDPYVKGTPTSTSKISSELHNLIVSLTGVALVLTIIIAVSVFRVVKKRMKKQRQRAGMLEDDFSINLHLSSSKEILNFSHLRADEL